MYPQWLTGHTQRCAHGDCMGRGVQADRPAGGTKEHALSSRKGHTVVKSHMQRTCTQSAGTGRDARGAGCRRTRVNTLYTKCTHNTQYLGHYNPVQPHTMHTDQPHHPHNITQNTYAIYNVHRAHPPQSCNTHAMHTKLPYLQHTLKTEHTWWAYTTHTHTCTRNSRIELTVPSILAWHTAHTPCMHILCVNRKNTLCIHQVSDSVIRHENRNEEGRVSFLQAILRPQSLSTSLWDAARELLSIIYMLVFWHLCIFSCVSTR